MEISRNEKKSKLLAEMGDLKKWAKEMVKGPRKGRFKANKAQKL